MKAKQFLIQFEYDDATRWAYSEQDLLAMLRYSNTSVGRCQTEGSEPRVSILVVVDPEPFDDRTIIVLETKPT
jgi:hypothetical protein